MWAFTIHDLRPTGGLSFDLRDVLWALEPSIKGYSWLITKLDCSGDDVIEEMCKFVEEGTRDGSLGLLLGWKELNDIAFGNIHQTIDAELTGLPPGTLREDSFKNVKIAELGPPTPKTIIIRAIDSSFFEVVTTLPEHEALLRRAFRDVRVQSEW